MKNTFGVEVSSIQSIAREMHDDLLPIMQGLMRYIGIADKNAAERILQSAIRHRNVHAYEREAHNLLLEATDKLKKLLYRRSTTMCEQIRPYLQEETVLDFGCGDGKIGEMIAGDRKTVTLADVYQHKHIQRTGLEFCLLEPQGHINAPDNSFDNTLVLTVLHHSQYPLENIAEVARVTKESGRVIVIETVYDVHDRRYCLRDEHFTHLTAEQQMKACAFFDHFFNRVFYYSANPLTKVPMPYNYRTRSGWIELFARNRLDLKLFVDLGIDQPLGPAEYHILYVLEKKLH